MSKLVTASLLLLALSLSIPAIASGKITVDPNAGKAVTEELQPTADITQKVTYEARRKTVASVLTDLSAMTGVPLKAGYNNDDWQVRDRKMNIFAKDIPLSNLMNSIARVMKFKWSKNEDTGTYRLYMDRNTLLGAERLRLIEEEKLRQRQMEARKKLLSGLEEAAGMPEGDLEKLKAQSPYVYVMAKRGFAGALSGLLTASPPGRQAFLSGETLTLDAIALPSDINQKLANAAMPFCGIPVPQEPQDKWELGSVTINALHAANNGVDTFIGNILIDLQNAKLLVGLMDPASDSAKLEAKLFDDQPLDTYEWNQIQKDLAQSRESEKKDLGEPLNEHTNDPILLTKVKMKVEGDEFAGSLAALSESSDFAVVSDSFDNKYQGLSFPKEEISVRAVLDKLESVCHYNWERHGSTLELHDRDWFKKRAYQIPDAWLENWRKTLKDSGLLDLDDLVQIARLTPEQLRGNIPSDDVLGNILLLPTIAGARDLLGFYSDLNKQQKGMIFTKQGLSLDSVSDNKSSAVQALLQRCPAGQGGLKLTGRKEKYGKQFVYNFLVVSSSGEPIGLQWTVISPLYVPPAKDKPEDDKAKQAHNQETKPKS